MPNLGENNTMHSVDVTPEMKESVMQGQTMFRVINEQAEEFNKSHKGGARVVNIDPSNMEAELAEEGFGTEDIQYFKERVEKGAQAFYDPERDLIYLFDPTVSKEDLKPILWHEDTHKAISDLDIDQDLLNEFYSLINKDNSKTLANSPVSFFVDATGCGDAARGLVFHCGTQQSQCSRIKSCYTFHIINQPYIAALAGLTAFEKSRII